VSLVFGLVATGALALALATDYWLFTSEPFNAENIDFPTAEENEMPPEYSYNNTTTDSYNTSAIPEYPDEPIFIETHSGLWRMCLVNELQGDEGMVSMYF
jgi:hypothetical protein